MDPKYNSLILVAIHLPANDVKKYQRAGKERNVNVIHTRSKTGDTKSARVPCARTAYENEVMEMGFTEDRAKQSRRFDAGESRRFR